jgi:hypothetical protein
VTPDKKFGFILKLSILSSCIKFSGPVFSR